MGCRRQGPTDDLVRVAKGPGGTLVVDRRAPGRGAWLCRNSPACLDAAVRRHGFERALASPLDRDAVEALRDALSGVGDRST